jgi:hypothetical protein
VTVTIIDAVRGFLLGGFMGFLPVSIGGFALMREARTADPAKDADAEDHSNRDNITRCEHDRTFQGD